MQKFFFRTKYVRRAKFPSPFGEGSGVRLHPCAAAVETN